MASHSHPKAPSDTTPGAAEAGLPPEFPYDLHPDMRALMAGLTTAMHTLSTSPSRTDLLRRTADMARRWTDAALAAAVFKPVVDRPAIIVSRGPDPDKTKLAERLAQMVLGDRLFDRPGVQSWRLGPQDLAQHPAWYRLKAMLPALTWVAAAGLEDAAGDSRGVLLVVQTDPAAAFTGGDTTLLSFLATAAFSMVRRSPADLRSEQRGKETIHELEQDRRRLKARVHDQSDDLQLTVTALQAEIDQRETVEQDLRRSREELRRMSRRALHTLEADRQTVSKELHDSIAANLAAIKFSLEEKLLHTTDTSSSGIPLEKIVGYLIDTIKETKRISTALRPTTLDDLGLISTIQWHCRKFTELYGHITVRPQIELEESDIPESMKIVIFRILQEAMSNAAKHGKATTIGISLRRLEGCVVLDVSDDGVGFDPESAHLSEDPMSGHGLYGMRERANIYGGSFELTSRPGEGTRIAAQLPTEGGLP